MMASFTQIGHIKNQPATPCFAVQYGQAVR